MAHRDVSPSSASSVLSMPPSSPAQSLSPDAFPRGEHEGPPKKRQRLANEGREEPLRPVQAIPEDFGDVSEDTDGSVPASPTHPSGAGPTQEEEPGDQVTVCKWDGCNVGDLGNMDNLVDHLHDAHILARQKRYSCEWSDCSRKGIPHASGYALRAHMRSHTREKPFYCSLPECDRSFTRSDALAKHMRTVHETEALRPSDPVPKHHSSNPSNKFQRLRLTIKSSNGTGGPGSDKSAPASPAAILSLPYSGPLDDSYENLNMVWVQGPPGKPYVKRYPRDIRWSEEEEMMEPADLLQHLQYQLVWASEASDALKKELDVLEAERRDEWVAKELLLENVMEAEVATLEERYARRPPREEDEGELDVLREMVEQARGAKALGLSEGKHGAPWWRSTGKWAIKAEANGVGDHAGNDQDVVMAEGPAPQ